MPRRKCFKRNFHFFRNKIVFVFPKCCWRLVADAAAGEESGVWKSTDSVSAKLSHTFTFTFFFFKFTDFFCFSAKLSHYFNFIQTHWLLQFLSKTLPLFHFHPFLSSNSLTSSVSYKNSPTLSLSPLCKFTDFFSFSAKLSHSFTFISANSLSSSVS